MKTKNIALLLVGVVMVSLGFLWFLQGADIIHLRPMLCVAKCEPITGKSLIWQAMGAITFFAGVAIVGASMGYLNRKRGK